MSDAIECPKCGHPPRDISPDYISLLKADEGLMCTRESTLYGHCRTGHRIAVLVTQDDTPRVVVLDK